MTGRRTSTGTGRNARLRRATALVAAVALVLSQLLMASLSMPAAAGTLRAPCDMAGMADMAEDLPSAGPEQPCPLMKGASCTTLCALAPPTAPTVAAAAPEAGYARLPDAQVASRPAPVPDRPPRPL
ncbi:MAG TPA: hypothetical protein VEB20_01845 [Azospirillaceae bacterium]|nr:hypothetical protein [Azospirillaceae bacterium]